MNSVLEDRDVKRDRFLVDGCCRRSGRDFGTKYPLPPHNYFFSLRINNGVQGKPRQVPLDHTHVRVWLGVL